MKYLAHISLTLMLLFGMLAGSSAQNIEELPKLKEIKGNKLLEEVFPKEHKNELWGYANEEGKFVIKPVFNKAYPYEGKVARVSLNEKWGTISDLGVFVIVPIYDRFDPYSADSLAVVLDSNLFYLIDTKGRKVQKEGYEQMEYANYGYKVMRNGKYGTLGRQGQVYLEPQFDVINNVEGEPSLKFVEKDGKWGILKDGKDILSLDYDSAPYPCKKSEGLYYVVKNNKYGIVTSYGQYVAPCVYDAIELHMTQKYYVTRIRDRYGAISLDMKHLVDPVNEKIPFIGERMFKMHYDGVFYAGNASGVYPFDEYMPIYKMFIDAGLEDDMAVFKQMPDWANENHVNENVIQREAEIANAGVVKDLLVKYNFDALAAVQDEAMPEGIDVFMPEESDEKYGMMDSGRFSPVAESEVGNHVLQFEAESLSGYAVNLVQMTGTNDFFLVYGDNMISVNNALIKYNVKEFDGIYPVDFALVPEERLIVRFAFIRSMVESSESLVETDPDKLPLQRHHIYLHKGSADPAIEAHAFITFDLNTTASTSFAQLPAEVSFNVFASRFGGFYTYSDNAVIADPDNTLRKYDRNGVFDWEYRPRTGEKFYGMEETENFIYLCGSTINTEEYGVEVPFVVQLTKRGEKKNEMISDVRDSYFSDIICKNHLIYAQTRSVRQSSSLTEYYPVFLLEDYGDNFGVRHKCVWEQWGDGFLGGCGLVSDKGKWLKRPILSWESIPDDPYYDWEFAGFTSDHLVFRHHGKFGLMNKSGDILIEPKYDVLEILDNPMYARVSLDRRYGVIDLGGKVIVPLEYDYVGRMSEDVIIVTRDGLYGCYDKYGQLIVPIEFPEIREFAGGLARARDARNKKNLIGYIDKKGEWTMTAYFEDVEDIIDECALVTGNNHIGMARFKNDSENGWNWDWIVMAMYDKGGSMSEGLAYMGNGGLFGYVDKTGKFVIPQQYSDVTNFYNGMAGVAKDGRWGVIDKNGSVVVPFKFDEVVITSDRYILVKKDDKWGIFKSDGTLLFPMECDSIELYKDNAVFNYGVAKAKIEGERLRIDEQGHVVWTYPIEK